MAAAERSDVTALSNLSTQSIASISSTAVLYFSSSGEGPVLTKCHIFLHSFRYFQNGSLQSWLLFEATFYIVCFLQTTLCKVGCFSKPLELPYYTIPCASLHPFFNFFPGKFIFELINDHFPHCLHNAVISDC